MSAENYTIPLSRIKKTAMDETSLPNSVMNRQQADRFIDLVVNESVLVRRSRVVRVSSNKGEVQKLDLGNIVTEGAATTSTPTTRIPQESVLTYDTVKYRSAFDLKTDFTEDNVEGVGVRDTLLNMFSKRIATDSEMAYIQGDDSLVTGDGQSNSNNLLGANDGLQTILAAEVPAAQQLDAAGAAPSKQLYYDMKRQIPNRYRIEKPNYVWIVPSGVHDKWMLDWSDRATTGGDAVLASGLTPGPWGIPMLEVPLMPEDLTFGTAGTDGSQIWLTPLANLVYFIQRDITLEWERVPRQDMWQSTVHFRVDFEVENPLMVVTALNVSLSGSDYT